MEDRKCLLCQDRADLMHAHMTIALVWDVIMDILAINVTPVSPFRVKLAQSTRAVWRKVLFSPTE